MFFNGNNVPQSRDYISFSIVMFLIILYSGHMQKEFESPYYGCQTID